MGAVAGVGDLRSDVPRGTKANTSFAVWKTPRKRGRDPNRRGNARRRRCGLRLLQTRTVPANSIYFNLAGGTFSQDWSNTGLITTDDDRCNAPSIVGFRADGLTASSGTDPQTITGTSGVV